jgi:hypothetical protein
MGECITAHVRSEKNPADMCTKVIPAGMKRRHLVGMLLLTFVIDCCVITLLMEDVCGSLGVSLLPVEGN